MTAPVEAFVVLSAMIFVIGGVGVLVRRSPLVILMCIELMWGAAALLFLSFSRQLGSLEGHVFAFLIVVVAAAEAAIGLAVIVLLFRGRDALDTDDMQALKG